MDNIELEKKVLEIIEERNYFNMMLKMQDFASAYKQSDFYKKTKMPLEEVIKQAKWHYMLNLDHLGKSLQEMLNGLNMENVTKLLDQITEVFGEENEEIRKGLEVMKNLK